MFSALRLGSIIYLLDKTLPSLLIGLVISVSSPLYYQLFNSTVDILARIDEKVIDLKLIPSALSIANHSSTGLVISESKEAMALEVDNMLKSSQLILDSIDYHKKVIESCDNMLKQLNPLFAKEKEQEEKIGALETKVTGIESSLSDIKTMLSKALNH